MHEPERTERYRKEESRERALQKLNESLRPLQQEIESLASTPRLPVLFVIGPPRSGTTLVSQLLSYSGSLGYVSNFLARFWLAPAVGARIEMALGMREEGPADPFRSEHGATRGWASPHEFGYFWNHWFDRGQETHRLSSEELASIDSGALVRQIASLESVYGMPMSFKNNTWCTFQAGWLARHFPTAVFLVCRRNPLYVAQSILTARRVRFGSNDAWWSVRPSFYRRILSLPWWEQVAAQALAIEREMDDVLATVELTRLIDVPYAELCAKPRAVFGRLTGRLAEQGFELRPAREIPEQFESTDVQQLPDEDWNRVRDAIDRLGK